MRPWLEGVDPAEFDRPISDAVDVELAYFRAWAARYAEEIGPVLGAGLLEFIEGTEGCELIGLWLLCVTARAEWADVPAASPEGGAS